MKRRWPILSLMVLLSLLTLSATSLAEYPDLIKNGGFEEGFANGVGNHWHAFHNGGLANFGFHMDDWDRVVWDGEYSQLIEISTKAYGGSERDRYAGIYQVVDVVPKARYEFNFRGMARSTEGNEGESKYGYRIQLGLDYDGGTDWQAVTDWIEMPWPEYPRMEPSYWKNHFEVIHPTSDKLTIFIRCWKKFGTARQEGDFNIDGVTLTGRAPSSASVTAEETPAKESLPATGLGVALPLLGLGLGLVIVMTRVLRRALLQRRNV